MQIRWRSRKVSLSMWSCQAQQGTLRREHLRQEHAQESLSRRIWARRAVVQRDRPKQGRTADQRQQTFRASRVESNANSRRRLRDFPVSFFHSSVVFLMLTTSVLQRQQKDHCRGQLLSAGQWNWHISRERKAAAEVWEEWVPAED